MVGLCCFCVLALPRFPRIVMEFWAGSVFLIVGMGVGERDYFYRVEKTSKQSESMKAGMESKAKSIIFSLPVSSIAGLRLLEEE